VKKKFDGIVRRLGHDIPASYIGSGDLISSDLFSDLSGAAIPHSGKAVSPKHDIIIIAGKNFGTGRCDGELFNNLRSAGTIAIIADSFSRDFYRGAVNHGIAVMESPSAYEKIGDDEAISIDLECGEIRSQQGITKISPIPEIQFKIYLAGGLLPYTKKLLGR
jgi:3-isopropylmalate/(R)-2-methylmalate dehydratase small subunit